MIKMIFTSLYFILEYFFGAFRSFAILCFSPVKYFRVFYGWEAGKFAALYARKRTALWRKRWDQAGRIQGVIPFTETRLIVCSAAELKVLRKRKLFPDVNPRKALKKKAIFKTVY